MNAIIAHELTRRFDDRVAVDHLSIEVAPGEVIGFLGPNGAGKTTTVRMLAGLIAPTSGTAEVAGFRIDTQVVHVRARVGLLTETPGLYDTLPAAQNLRLFAHLYGCDDVEGRIRRWLERFGLWERRDDPPGSFSKGMRQKLAIARALLHDPPVLFLDEPTSGLDPEAATVVRDAIASLRNDGRTIFLCTHNLTEAERLCDRVALFKTRLIAVDTPRALRDQLFGRQVAFHVGRADDALLAVLRAVPGVIEVARNDSRLVARIDDPEATNPAAVRALVAAGADVRFVGEVRHSLEEVYHELLGARAGTP